MSTKTSPGVKINSQRKYFTPKHDLIELPHLIEVQTSSFDWFIKEGLKELFKEISPISDFTGKDLELSFDDYYFDDPKIVSTTRTKEDIERAIIEIEGYRKAIETSDFTCSGNILCRTCEYSLLCGNAN